MSETVNTFPTDNSPLNRLGQQDGADGGTPASPAVPRPTDPILFEHETGPHIDALYRNAVRLTGNSNDAEDLVQDTYLRAYRFFYQYQPGTNAKAWLFRIMNTVFLNDYRKKSRQGDTVSYDGLEDFYLYNKVADDSSASPQQQAATNPQDVVLNRLDREAIEAAIGQLPVEFRDTVALATLEGLGVPGDQRYFADPHRNGALAPLARQEASAKGVVESVVGVSGRGRAGRESNVRTSCR